MRAIQEAYAHSSKKKTCEFIEEDSDICPFICHSPRLFFSPTMTKSIMEEARARAGAINFSEENTVLMVVALSVPCTDVFRASMEEMVEAHGPTAGREGAAGAEAERGGPLCHSKGVRGLGYHVVFQLHFHTKIACF